MRHVLILSPAAATRLDRSANAVARSIAGHGGSTTVVGAIELATARWCHRVGDGGASTVVHLADGRAVDTATTDAVLNRIPALAPVGFDAADERERTYAAVELQALFVSFLRSFSCPVLNGVDGQAPLGLWSWTRWSALAHRCGLTVDSRATGSDLPRARDYRTVVIVGGRAFDASDESPQRDDVAARCRQLASEAGLIVLGVTLMVAPTPRVVRVDPFPPLGGASAAAAATLLCRAASSTDGRAA